MSFLTQSHQVFFGRREPELELGGFGSVRWTKDCAYQNTRAVYATGSSHGSKFLTHTQFSPGPYAQLVAKAMELCDAVFYAKHKIS